ncbi:hypothetical protein D3C87_1059780 [compost metagenome]
MKRIGMAACLAAGLFLVLGLPAWADRDATPEERAAIERVLRANGYVAWDDIEYDDEERLWEVDDARTSDGKEYDLKLRPGSLEIVSRRLD